MSLAAMTPEEREVVRRAMAATFRYFDFDFQTRLGVTPEEMRELLEAWPQIDDTGDDSDACLAINNSLNDLLNGVGISERESLDLLGASRDEVERIYKKWARARGWKSRGVR
jgi:hypothetical protein